ncbi:hypothetical protein BT63DRAFT_379776 [Microthyrium microscopicum]|uniref:RTA1-domain-containing protein n=1 Tax=Microthyrium microscopicum TaxID=703497 RepID=A0A6A6TXC7_9PEZI|nr:hypothetical protein BT63DRAFT_379776 [Microthyrium microscopicum]
MAVQDGGWSFCPNVGVAYFFAVIFALLTIAHFSQMIIHRKVYSLVIVISAILQTLVFIFRIISINNPSSSLWYTLWFVIILIAPLWTNAYVYMIMGRMVHNFLPQKKLFGIKARRFGLYFVLLDVIAFLVQVSGAGMASGDNVSASQLLLGIHVYMAGIGFQQFFIFVFLALAVKFQQTLNRDGATHHRIGALRLLYVLYAVLFLITVRIIFRLIEYSHGINSTIPNHEVYMYIFDTTPMWIAILLFNIVHPGRIMPGKESDLPSRKEYKREKKEIKEAKNAAKKDGQEGSAFETSGDLESGQLPGAHEYSQYSTPQQYAGGQEYTGSQQRPVSPARY